MCALLNLGALVASAHLLLGNVLRDTDLLLRWLTSAVQPIERQALVVALGLLRRPVPMELAWPDPSDAEDAAAYLRSVALGVDDEGERIDLASVADMRAQGLARDISEKALVRIEFGERLG